MANSYREYLKMKKYGGEGGDTPSPTLISKTINANGLYLPEDDQADGYNSVSVNVPEISDIAFVPPQKFKSNGSNLEDYKIFGSDDIVIETETSVLPLTFTTTEDKLRDWEIRGNDEPGENLLPNVFRQGSTNAVGTANRITATTCILCNVGDTFSVKAEGGFMFAFYLTNEAGYQQFTNSTLLDIANRIYDSNWRTTFTKTITETQAKCIIIMVSYSDNSDLTPSDAPQSITLVRGSTAPDHYIPYQQGVGERTENLFNDDQFDITTPLGTVVYIPVAVGEGEFTLSTSTPLASNTRCVFLLEGNVSTGASNTVNGIYNGVTRTVTAVDGFVTVAYRNYSSIRPGNYDTMLVKGSTAPSSYVPYGYEIPIKVTKHKTYPIQWALKGKAVRDQVTSTKGNETLTWDVIGIDHDECYYADGRRAAHSVTLQLHDCFTSLQFDEREALFYAESAMPAGTYHFTLREQPWYAADVNKTFEFTLTQALAAGSQICVTNAYNAAITSGKVKTYSGGTSTTAIETVDITEGNGGTDLGDVRNALVGQNTNSIQRASLGSNNWANSAVRQWLNSSAEAGSVWTPKTKFDRPPSWVSSIAGFLNGMDENFVKAVGTVKKITALNTVTDGGGKVESDERFFLLSRSEVYGGNEVAGGEGAAYSYYADYSYLSGAGTDADTNRIKYRNNAVQFWWLRSPYVPTAHDVRYVYTTGGVEYIIANGSLGVAPAICIPMDEVYDCNEVDIYIGNSPLTAGQSISKTSTGVDIATTEGENTISTTLYNKPETSVTYAESGGVGEESSGSYSIPVKINSTTTNVPIGDTPLMEDEYVSYAEQKIYRYVDGTLTPVDPPSALPQIATANGVNELSVETDIQPELVQIGLGIPVELIPTALGIKNITANDTYDASDDSLDGYSSVTVNVPEKVLTTKTITASGTYNAVEDQADGYSSVTVNVSSYNETWVNRIDFVITEVTS